MNPNPLLRPPEPPTLLGAEQEDWLKGELEDEKAEINVIVRAYHIQPETGLEYVSQLV